ncbi:hypothetical protein BEWA_017910 [Theileria equi strain WA]|uniref:Uncharacterized protein n=1 Tax=Theileria equi strain WA TaxID=1537102 RepID=L0ATT4_THEEQ|nr:hypothetical protein BEWA_017910 [Theileria equi strain WA]AFZ78950.1 hypothetical protein BEWA_017910 [Theileria equi strain WA]|eukprot:XP_004828616.1 hypothetical protein BEWA_017910 [Theileria equi strain WA]
MGNPELETNDCGKLLFARQLTRRVSFKGPDWGKIIGFFDKQAQGLGFLEVLAKRLNMSPGAVLLVIFFLVLVLFITRAGGSIICDTVGFLYPAYKSYKALKLIERLKTNPEDHSFAEGSGLSGQEYVNAQLTYWTKYWIVFSLGFIFNYLAGIFLSWLPFYYILKLLFIVTLLHHKFQGAEAIYRYVISPILQQYEDKIDAAVELIESAANNVLSRYSIDALSERIKDFSKRE